MVARPSVGLHRDDVRSSPPGPRSDKRGGGGARPALQVVEADVPPLAYAQVRAGEIAVGGLAEAHSVWPALDVPGGDRSRMPARDWADARERMEAGLAVLAREIRNGRADVAPRERTTCQYCRLKPLCRIRVLDDLDDSARGATADE